MATQLGQQRELLDQGQHRLKCKYIFTQNQDLLLKKTVPQHHAQILGKRQQKLCKLKEEKLLVPKANNQKNTNNFKQNKVTLKNP